MGDGACLSCHQQKASFELTAHRLTSRLPTRASILGSFSHGENALRTMNPNLYFRMDSTATGFYEIAVMGRAPDTSVIAQRIAYVTGLRKGQSYLYWVGDQLYQLPVSTGGGRGGRTALGTRMEDPTSSAQSLPAAWSATQPGSSRWPTPVSSIATGPPARCWELPAKRAMDRAGIM